MVLRDLVRRIAIRWRSKRPSVEASPNLGMARNLTGALNSQGQVLSVDERSAVANAVTELLAESISVYASDGAVRQLRHTWEPEANARLRVTKRTSRIRFDLAEPAWYVGLSKDFMRSVSKIDRKLQGRILDAVATISKDPITPHGNTLRPLSGEKDGMWRYRIGDYRLIYHPDSESKHIILLTFSPRGSAYD